MRAEKIVLPFFPFKYQNFDITMMYRHIEKSRKNRKKKMKKTSMKKRQTSERLLSDLKIDPHSFGKPFKPCYG